MGPNEILAVFFTFYVQLEWNSVQEMTIAFWVIVSFVKIGMGIEAHINFCLYFPHLSSSFGWKLYKRPADTTGEHLWFLQKSAQGRMYFPK
jgi:hypothetical protein